MTVSCSSLMSQLCIDILGSACVIFMTCAFLGHMKWWYEHEKTASKVLLQHILLNINEHAHNWPLENSKSKISTMRHLSMPAFMDLFARIATISKRT